MLFFVLVVD